MDILQELTKIFVHIVVPSLAGILFFALAKFARHIKPLRALVSSPRTYDAAFWGFLFFALYIALRPVQVLAGPHPRPLIFSSLREFILVALFGPTTFLGLLTLCFGPRKISKRWIIPIFTIGGILGTVFCVANAFSVGGSKEIVKLGMMTAYDGLWYESAQSHAETLMQTMFWIRLFDPGILLLVAAGAVFWHARHYPSFKAKLYDNMPKKLYILGSAVALYSVTLIAGSCFYGFRVLPDQWPIYPFVLLLSGFLEVFSISLPVRHAVQVSEHLQTKEAPTRMFSTE